MTNDNVGASIKTAKKRKQIPFFSQKKTRKETRKKTRLTLNFLTLFKKMPDSLYIWFAAQIKDALLRIFLIFFWFF